MSVFTEPTSIPSRVRGAFRYLLHIPDQSVPREQMIAALAPESLSPTDHAGALNAVTKTIRECIKMKLFEEVGTTIRLGESLDSTERDRGTGDAALRSTITRLLFSSNNESNTDFARALGWLLTFNPYDSIITWSRVEQLLPGSVAETLGFNDARFGNLEDWAVFLGYCRSSSQPAGLIPDPTKAVRRSLSRLLRHGQRESIESVLRQLSKSDPVLDGGVYALAANNPGDVQLSMALSLALTRLRDEGFLTLDYAADAKSRKLRFLQHEQLESCTHIQRNSEVNS